MKRKFNFKLTIFLVSLFLGLLLTILGGKSYYCLSFGLIMLGISLALFVWYNDEQTTKNLGEIEQEIDEITSVDIEDEELEKERIYILGQLLTAQKKLIKKKKSVLITFSLCGFALVVLGFINLF